MGANESKLNEEIRNLQEGGRGYSRYGVRFEPSKDAAEALGKLGDPRAVEPLIEALGCSGRAVDDAIIEALGKLGDPVQPLIEALGDNSRYIRKGAARALGELGDPRAVEPLLVVMEDSDRGVSNAAGTAYRKLKVKALAKAVSTASEVREELVDLKRKRERGEVTKLDIQALDESEDKLEEAKAVAEVTGDARVLAEVTNLIKAIGRLRPTIQTTIQDSVMSRSSVGGGDDLMSQLERLGAMKEKGLLTDDEFARTKAKLIGE